MAILNCASHRRPSAAAVKNVIMGKVLISAGGSLWARFQKESTLKPFFRKKMEKFVECCYKLSYLVPRQRRKEEEKTRP
jgi:hypothetical protein